jgi:hypothetical protein
LRRVIEGIAMRRWISRALRALVISAILPTAATAQPVTPPAAPVAPRATAPAADTLPTPTPGAAVPGQAGPVIVVPNGAILFDPYHAATPYNPFINQPVPNPLYNRPWTTLPCNVPNINPDPYVPVKKGCKHKGDCGCDDCQKRQGLLKKACHSCDGICSKGGSCTTCCNTDNFIFGSSRSYFGESSREFFERPPSPDGVKMCAKSYLPPPAPAAYTPPNVVVVYVRDPPKQEKSVAGAAAAPVYHAGE